jgi:putative flippase GtrA
MGLFDFSKINLIFMNYTDIFFKFLKFGVVGVSGTAVDFGITYVLKEWLKTNKFVANSIGFSVAVTTNFIFNRIFTFQSQDADVFGQYMKFCAIGLVGLAMNNLIIYLCDKKFGLGFYTSKLAATLIVMLWNFGANFFFTFK